jgi:hypothetical protein
VNARWLLLSPLLLLVALAAILTAGTTSVSAAHGPETRVRAIPAAAVDAVGQQSSETAGSVGCLRSSPPSSASGSCVATEAASLWSLGPGPRGLAIEDALGGNLPAGFKTFDRFPDGVATSIKSVDLSAPSYQSAGALTSRLSGYVDSVAAFDNYSLSGFSLSSSEISTRALEIAIQPGVGSSAQMAALNNVIAYGSSQGVVVRVVTVP